MTRVPFFLIFILLLELASCKKKNGCIVERGKTEIRELVLPTFHTIDQNIRANFILSSGEQQKVTIEGAKSILNLIEKESFVENEVWHLGFTSCVHEYEPIKINVQLPNYVAFTNNGIGETVSTSNLSSNNSFSVYVGGNGDVDLSLNDLANVNVEISGNSNVTISGKAISEKLIIKGNGTINSFDLYSTYSNVEITGTGNCSLRASDSLNVKITGNGNVYYKGFPDIIQTILGNGNVIDAN